MAEYPFDISPMYEGERVRKGDMYVELGGPKSKGFELVLAADMDEINDDNVTIIGPDLKEMEEGGRYPFAMTYKIGGEDVEKDLEAVVERRNHDFQNYLQGFMHLNQRYDIWIRINKDSIKKGLNSLKEIASATMELFKTEMPFIEKMEAIYITDAAEVEKELEPAKVRYEERDARTRDLHDEDVDTFYSCTLCQGFAPTNVCVISPDRVSLCGAINWFDGRAAAKVDPEGPNRAIPIGEVLDPFMGEYSGINEFAQTESKGEYNRIKLHSFFDYPHTSCGCFEVIGFYMPELDTIGWVDRDYGDATPNGLTFSTMAGQTGGGKQIVGFLGIGVEYFRSPKFIQSDGGWERVAWLPSRLVERISESIPDEMRGKIATEIDATTLDELKEFMKEKGHPMVEKWVEEKEEVVEEAEALTQTQAVTSGGQQVFQPQMMAPQFSFAQPTSSGSGITLVLKDAKISIGKIVVRKKE